MDFLGWLWPGLFGSSLIQDSKSIAAKEVFETQKLLETILGNLSTKELLQGRFLNKAWNAEACKILGQRKSLRVRQWFGYTQEELDSSSDKSYPERAQRRLELFTEAFARSSQKDSIFPHCEFHIYNPQLRSAVSDTFLLAFGHRIQNFLPDFPFYLEKDTSEFLDRFIDLIFNQLPNIRQLSFSIDRRYLKEKEPEYFRQFFQTTGCPPVARVLPKLKLLELHSNSRSPILKYVLHAAINLEEIHLWLIEPFEETVKTTEELIAQDKARIVSSLRLFLNKQIFQPTEILLEILRVKTLELFWREEDMTEDVKARARSIINKLFDLNANVLQKLHMHHCFWNPAYSLPVMPKLHTLELTHTNYSEYRCEPFAVRDFKMSKIFPRLKALKTEIIACEAMKDLLYRNSFFGISCSDEVFTVKSIDLCCQPGGIFTRNLPRMFPNLVYLNMEELWNVPQALNAFWSLSHLKVLKFGVIRDNGNDEGLNENLGYQMESAFTGFSIETCLQLASENKELDLETVDALRVNRSMLDAKCLREMHIKIYECFEEETPSVRKPLLSRVAGQFAFKMCPQVLVYVKVYPLDKENLAASKTDVDSLVEYVTSVRDGGLNDPGSTWTFRCNGCKI